MIEMNLRAPVMVSDHKLLQNTKNDAAPKVKDNEKLNVVVSDSRHAETPIAKMKQKQNRKKRQSE
jgi:hypothetical protein